MMTTWIEATELIKDGSVGVVPTDTLYGVVAPASNVKAVERIYELKERAGNKPLIVLISDASQIAQFGVDATWVENAQAYWPGPVSIILPCSRKQWKHIHRGSQAIAFRLPDDEQLQTLLSKTGPIVAPSANPQGLPPAITAEEAYSYFGDAVDFYVDEGERNRGPSKLLKLTKDGVEQLR